MTTPSDGLGAVGAQVLSASEDPDHEVRIVAGRLLMAGLSDSRVEQALRRLVDDPENTAVSEQVACAQVSSGGKAGLRLVVSCLAEMDVFDTAAHWVLDGMTSAWHEDLEAAQAAMAQLFDDEDPQVAAGARWAHDQWQRSRAAAAAPPPKRRRWW